MSDYYQKASLHVSAHKEALLHLLSQNATQGCEAQGHRGPVEEFESGSALYLRADRLVGSWQRCVEPRRPHVRDFSF